MADIPFKTLAPWTVLSMFLFLMLGIACSGEGPVEEEGPFGIHPPRVWSYDTDDVGTVPAGWEVGETGSRGTTAQWQIVEDNTAPSPPKVLAITENQNQGHTYNLIMEKETRVQDLVLEVKVKAHEGVEDQGGGPIWRARDQKNYYLARWNPLENNFRLYHVIDGQRRQLETIEAKVDEKGWHTISIEHKGTRIRASLDGGHVMVIRDDTFMDAGRVGLWVKADGKTAFDDLSVAEVK